MNKNLLVLGGGLILLGVGIIAWTSTWDSNSQTGDDLAINEIDMNTEQPQDLVMSIPAFNNNEPIPTKFSCDGDNVSPEIQISGVPDNAQSLVLIMDDPDVPTQVRTEGVFDHWVIFNIPVGTAVIPEGQNVGVVGSNGRGESAYTGPCPPTEYEPTEHRYVFRLFALDRELDLEEGATKDQVLEALEGSVISESILIGTFDRA
jgi:Raf kinase inhibitor-like YbhB/YbcL family protein